MDPKLSFNTQINEICKSSFYFLYNIKKIRKFLTKENNAVLIHAFITCKLDYCNSLYYGLPVCQIAKLQRVQNAAARLVCAIRYDHITPILMGLRWLPVRFRIIFKLLSFVFKSLHCLAPPYISTLINVKEQSSYNLKSNNELLLAAPSTRFLPTLGAHSFTASAPKEWNSLPTEIRSIASYDSFRQKLRTFLFRKAFYL